MMVRRALKWFNKIRLETEEARDALNEAIAQFSTAISLLNKAIETWRNAETLIQPNNLLSLVGHDPTLIREFLEAIDPWTLRVAWLGIDAEKRQAIMVATQDGEAEIKRDEAE